MCGQFEKLSRVLVKDDQQIGENVDHELSQLDEKFFASPALALSAASDAIGAMARLARTGVMSALDVLHHFDRHTIDVIDRNEDHIDALADSVDNYLIKLSSHVPPGHGNDLLNYYIQCFSEFERIGDYAVNLTENAEELRSKGIEFSETAQQELQVLGEALREIMDYAYRSFTAVDAQTAAASSRWRRSWTIWWQRSAPTTSAVCATGSVRSTRDSCSSIFSSTPSVSPTSAPTSASTPSRSSIHRS